VSMLACGRKFLSQVAAAEGDDAAEDDIFTAQISAIYVRCLVRSLRNERNLFPVLLRSKEGWPSCELHARFVACLCADLADLYSQCVPVFVDRIKLGPSALMQSLHDNNDSCHPHHLSLSLTESLLWFYKLCQGQASVFRTDTHMGGGGAGGGSTDFIRRSVAFKLVLPVSAALVVLCAASGDFSCMQSSLGIGTNHVYDNKENDSDLSIRKNRSSISKIYGQVYDLMKDETMRDHPSYELMLIVCHALHCIDILAGALEDKRVASCYDARAPLGESYAHGTTQKNGPHFLIVLTRALGTLSDLAMLQHNGSKEIGSRWAESYPPQMNAAGLKLDALLSRAYRLLHGFTIHSSLETAAATPSSSNYSPAKTFVPENVTAASSLYRFVVRRRFGGTSKKKSGVPHAILSCIESALSPRAETAESQAVRDYIFRARSIEEDVARFEHYDGYSLPNRFFPSWVVCKEDIGPNDTHVNKKNYSYEEEECIVRCGLCKMWARGHMPTLNSILSDNYTSFVLEEEQNASVSVNEHKNTEDRKNFIQLQVTLSKKVTAIIEGLCHDDPSKYENWFIAGQCFTELAEIVNDRLGHVCDYFSQNGGNFLPVRKFTDGDTYDNCHCPVSTEELQQRRRNQYECHLRSTTHAICDDMAIFLKFPWCSFAGLVKMSDQLKDDPCMVHNSCAASTALKKIQNLLIANKKPSWQRAWGGLYIAAFRTMADRCLCVSHYLAQKGGVDAEELCSIREFIASVAYTKIQGGTTYGFPLALLPEEGRLHLATCAERFLRESIRLNDEECEEEDRECGLSGVPKWQLYFMLGKCLEKKASAFQREKILVGKTSFYSMYMKEALTSYNRSIQEGKKLQNIYDVRQGGSSNGIIEAIYRLHASRLKVLLRTVKFFYGTTETAARDAELQALDISDVYWFDAYEAEQMRSKYGTNEVRERIWCILSDVVEAMVHCRQESVFFHRSVFRHAQALLWAPIIYDPDDDDQWNFSGYLPPMKSLMLRGMNSTGTSPSSAEAIIQSLFDKKRPQVCAVWVTTPVNPSPFELLNNSVRKYTMLRSKYTSAFIDCICLCNRVETLSTLINWVKLCPRDLPSFYHVTANNNGGCPKNHHRKDSLLAGIGYNWSARQKANSGIAEIILKKVNFIMVEKLKDKGGSGDNKDLGTTKQLRELLQSAYECFRCMNVSIDEVGSLNYEMPIEIEALLRICQVLFNDFPPIHAGIKTLMEFAILKIRELFSTTSEQKKRKPSVDKAKVTNLL